MPTEISRALIEERYDRAAQEYLRRLPLEHFMEATPQSTQRKITVCSFELIHRHRPDIQLFSELLVQYPVPGRKRLGQVVPDNMVVVHSEPIVANTNYSMALQPVGPFLVLEYVSKKSRRKDYKDNVRRYEQELKVPYYLIFHPEKEELLLYRLVGDRYVAVQPNENGRLAVPRLEIEVSLDDAWIRFWFRGELLLLPDALQQSLDETRWRLAEMTDVAESEHQRAESERQRAESERQRAESERQRAEKEHQALFAAEAEIARLRALLEQRQPPAGES